MKSRRSAELERSWLSTTEEDGVEDYSSSNSSIRKGLQQLRKKIRLAKYLDVKDNVLLHNLVNTPPVHVRTDITNLNQ